MSDRSRSGGRGEDAQSARTSRLETRVMAAQHVPRSAIPIEDNAAMDSSFDSPQMPMSSVPILR